MITVEQQQLAKIWDKVYRDYATLTPEEVVDYGAYFWHILGTDSKERNVLILSSIFAIVIDIDGNLIVDC